MISYNLGEIVLVQFPHSDMQSISKRPALVLYDSGDRDVLVARITSQEYSTQADFKIIDWEKCGLLDVSCIRLGKLATIEKQLIVRKLGTLGDMEINGLKSIMIKMFSLK